MLKITIPVEKGNQTIADGSLPRKMQAIVGDLKPEAAYFLALEGKRTCLLFLDLADSSQIPMIAEPFFLEFNAEVEFYPVMNADDLRKGIEGAMGAVGKYK
jgi:hypothetical protein